MTVENGDDLEIGDETIDCGMTMRRAQCRSSKLGPGERLNDSIGIDVDMENVLARLTVDSGSKTFLEDTFHSSEAQETSDLEDWHFHNDGQGNGHRGLHSGGRHARGGDGTV